MRNIIQGNIFIQILVQIFLNFPGNIPAFIFFMYIIDCILCSNNNDILKGANDMKYNSLNIVSSVLFAAAGILNLITSSKRSEAEIKYFTMLIGILMLITSVIYILIYIRNRKKHRS